MKRFMGVFFFLFFVFLELAEAKSMIKIICDVDDSKVYVDGKFKAICYANSTLKVIAAPGSHVIEVKKPLKSGIYYYYKKVVQLGDGVIVSVKVKSQKRYTETYYWKKALKSNQPEDYLLYLKKYPKGKYARKAKAKLKKIRYLVKVWDRTFGNSKQERANAIIETKDGGYLVAGFTESYGNGWEDIWLIKIDKNGNKVWDKTFGGSSSDEAKAIIETRDGGYLVAGFTESYGNGWDDIWLIKIDKNGNKIWDKTFGGSDNDRASAIIETRDRGYLLAGFTRSYGNGWDDIWLIKIDKNGNKLWDKTFGGSKHDIANAIIETRDGGYLVAGFTDSYGNGEENVWIIKLKPIK